MDSREQWNSQIGFLLAAVGSAIGLGNIWRFSYMAYNYGGGAFLVPYITALVTAGIPLLILEFAMGHERMGSAPLACHKIRPGWEWLGWWAVTFVMFGIVLYYMVVVAWCLNFMAYSFTLAWGNNPDTFFFKDFLQVSSSPALLGGFRAPVLVALTVVWFVNWAIVFRGISNGIELANKIFMPTLFILTCCLVIWAVNLDGATTGLRAYVTPDFSKILSPKVWIDAYSQIFFTLSLGFGIMIAYASYLPRQSNITKNAILTALINSGYSLLAGVGVFSVLGFMAVSQGKPLSEVVSQSIGLAFVAYPQAISLMPGGKFFGAIFFFCLFVAGISSSISIIEAFTSAIIDKFGCKRKPLVTLLALAGMAGSLVFATRAGLLWLDIVDHMLTHYGLVVVGIGECILTGWFFNTAFFRTHLNSVSSVKLGPWWDVMIRWFIPFALGIILLSDIAGEIKKPYGGYSWQAIFFIGWLWILATLAISIVIARGKWRKRPPY